LQVNELFIMLFFNELWTPKAFYATKSEGEEERIMIMLDEWLKEIIGNCDEQRKT